MLEKSEPQAQIAALPRCMCPLGPGCEFQLRLGQA